MIVAAGLRYGDVAAVLHEHRVRALKNLGSLPHIGVAGAVATAPTVRVTATGISPPRYARSSRVTASGELETIARRRRRAFLGSVVGLGALGVVTA